MYGMALHTASDTFAHSAYVNSKRITHPSEKQKEEGIKGADDTDYYGSRYACAKAVARKLLAHIKDKEIGRLADWVITSNAYTGSFKLVGFAKFAKPVNSNVYDNNIGFFSKMNLDVSSIVKY